jgi:glycosyltransferase involved in cell wall biosynthesis
VAERPRVGIDATTLSAFGKGVSRYARELLPELARADLPVEPIVLAPAAADVPAGARGLPRISVRGRPATVWEQFELPRVARRSQLALVHTTSDRLPVTGTTPIVLYLFEDPKYRLAASAARTLRHRAADTLTAALFERSIRRAAAIVVSSRATAADLEERGVGPDRIRLVYPGVSAEFRPAETAERDAIRAELAAPEGYVLHFSSDDPRDNSAVVLRAYAAANAQVPLLVAGPVEASLQWQRELASSLGIAERVRWVGYQRGAALLQIYRGALAYVDPSLYEGFGFQVAEALASGVPVICSNTTSLPEVTGGAGLLAAPDDVQGFAEGLERVLADQTFREDLAARGVAQAARFTWRASVQGTVAVWQDILR